MGSLASAGAATHSYTAAHSTTPTPPTPATICNTRSAHNGYRAQHPRRRGSQLSGERPAPDGLAFYAPPAPLAAGRPDGVIWSRQLTSVAALPDAAENLLVLYHSRTLAGQDTAVTGTVSIPPGQPPAGGWPVLSWAHGTTGVADICAPSRDGPGHPSHIYNQLADAMLNQWIKRGWVVTKTDYESLGTPGLHPYLVGASEARGLTDIVRRRPSAPPGHRHALGRAGSLPGRPRRPVHRQPRVHLGPGAGPDRGRGPCPGRRRSQHGRRTPGRPNTSAGAGLPRLCSDRRSGGRPGRTFRPDTQPRRPAPTDQGQDQRH